MDVHRRGNLSQVRLFPGGVADDLVCHCFLEGGVDLFCEGGIGWSDLGEEVEGVGGGLELAEVGLGVGEGEEVVCVFVLGELAETGGEGEGFLGAANFLVGMGGENSGEKVGGFEKFG